MREPRSKQRAVRWSPEEDSRIVRFARKMGMHVSEFIRMAVIAFIRERE